MQKPVIRYFDFAGSRGEEVRLALVLAGVAFDDDRLGRDAFAEIKPGLPFGSVPVLELPGRGMFTQTNAILRLVGRKHGLHPDDPFDGARLDAVLEASEDLRHRISATTRMTDAAEKKAARQALATSFIPQWASGVEVLIGDGPFVGGAKPAVADIKIHMMEKALSSGTFDDIPETVLAPFKRIAAVTRGIAEQPAVRAWYASKG